MKKSVAIVGGGACALMLACELDPEKFEVSVYEKNSALGRKFLVAGEGGLNLTHSEKEEKFISRYTPFTFFEKSFAAFSNKDLVNWMNALGVPTYVGTSGRVFPEQGIKPIEVLNSILKKIQANKVKIITKYVFKDFFSRQGLIFENDEQEKNVEADLIIFCLGGSSWPVTGSTGDWATGFKRKGINLNSFEASNCSFKISWPAELIPKIEGTVLKNISATCEAKTHLGEIVLTRFGMEGSGIYPLSPEIKGLLKSKGKAPVFIDFKPNVSLENIIEKIKAKPSGKNITEYLKTNLNLSATQVHLLKNFLSKEEFLDTTLLSKSIKHFKVTVEGLGPVEDAISTTGGIDLNEIDEHFQLKKLPGHFVIGEMLDYDAPTGGYLLQSCFSMANYLAGYLNLTHF